MKNVFQQVRCSEPLHHPSDGSQRRHTEWAAPKTSARGHCKQYTVKYRNSGEMKRSESLLPFQRTSVKRIDGSPGVFTAWRGSQHLKCSITGIDCSRTSFNSLLFFIMSKVNIDWIPIIWTAHYNKSSIFSFFTYTDAFILIFHAVSMSSIFYTASRKFRR